MTDWNPTTDELEPTPPGATGPNMTRHEDVLRDLVHMDRRQLEAAWAAGQLVDAFGEEEGRLVFEDAKERLRDAQNAPELRGADEGRLARYKDRDPGDVPESPADRVRPPSRRPG